MNGNMITAIRIHRIIAVICLLYAATPQSSAKPDDHKPGIYAIVNGEYVPLPFYRGITSVSGENRGGVEITYKTYRYNGETSGVVIDSTFILVVNPDKKRVTNTLKQYDPFIRNMKPEKSKIVPLEVNAESGCREFKLGKNFETLRFEEHPGMEYEWVQISDSSYKIKPTGLTPGEYCFVYRPVDIFGFDYTAIFAFTVK